MKRQTGFTLVEIMVAVVIVGILVAIAIPSYQEYMRKTRRVEAKTALTTLASAMERYYLQNNTYVGATVGMGGLPATTTAPGGYYTISIASQTAETYQLKAAPLAQGPQASDAKCTSFTLDSAGGRGASGTGSVSDCW